MTKQFSKTTAFLIAGVCSLGIAAARQNSPATAPKPPAAQSAPAAKTPPSASTSGSGVLKTQKEKASYAVGMTFGSGLRKDLVDVDPDALVKGVRDALAGSKPLLSDAEANAALKELQTEVHQAQEVKMQQMGVTNKKEGEAFLAANKTKEGVVALPSGLQYKVLKQGTGPKPALSDTVVCNYRGTLIDSTEFDSSYKRGQPASFPVGQVIKGWTEALQLMPVGSKYQLFVPSELAYGDHGAGADIGPNAVLIFEVELLSIKGK
jgi:FKBP-type peptidyl-prolyl cis-trans isomerase FklB